MIGTTVGNYRIVNKLGDGGMGSVYRALDEMLDREVAIKVLRPELSRNASLIERFRQEAIALARLNHPNIATLHGLERHGESLIMVMEFVRGDTLEAIVQRSGRIAWRRAAELVAEVLEALDHAHDKGVVHRDIKPANVMLDASGTVKVMDFGIARLMGKNRQTQVGHAVGTPTYMAPEQLRGEEVDGRTDLYAAGAVLFELITGSMAFEADSDYSLMMKQLNDPPPAASSVVPEVPGAIDSIIMRAMAKRRDDRFASANAFREALLQAIAANAPAERKAPVAPATRLADTPPNFVPTGAEVQRTAEHSVSGAPNAAPPTRLADDVSLRPGSNGHGASAHAPPATRLADAARAEASATEPAYASGERTSASAASSGAGRLSDWRTYAIATAVLVAAGLGVRAFRSTDTTVAADTQKIVPNDTKFAVTPPPTEPKRDSVAVAPPPRREDASSLVINPPPANGIQPVQPPPTSGGGAEGGKSPPAGRNSRPPRGGGPNPPTKSGPPNGKEVVTPPVSPPAEPPATRRETPPPAESESAARASIQEALQNAASMLSGQNSSAASILAGSVQKDWGNLLKEGRISMKIAGDPSIDVSGTRATASFEASVNVRSPFGANRRKSARFTAELSRNGGWHVTSLRPSGDLDLK